MVFSRRQFVLPFAALGLNHFLSPLADALTLQMTADVLIVGGSLGGVAAALAAARMGCQVVLVEETEWIGGQATTQGVPLDEHPWIEDFGRTSSYASFRRDVRSYYRTRYPLSGAARADPQFNPGACWVSACGFEPRVGLAVLYRMLAPFLSSGQVRLYTRTIAESVDRRGDHVGGVVLRSLETDERLSIDAPYVLDATELGDLLPLAGVEWITGSESATDTGEPSASPKALPLEMQGFTHLIAVDYFPGEDHTIGQPGQYSEMRSHFNSLVGEVASQGDELTLRGRRLFSPVVQDHYESSIWNFRRVFCSSNFASGAFPSDVTMLMNGNECDRRPLVGVNEAEKRATLEYARQLSLALLYFLQTEVQPGYKGKPGFPGLRARGDQFGTLDGLAQYPYIRESRRIRAEFTVLEQHFRVDSRPTGPMLYPDSVGLSGYRMDIHQPSGKGQSMTLALNGHHWVQQIPLGALLPVRVENLLPACKNLGTTHITNGAFRVHPAEWNIGESAGALAAFCVQRKVLPRQVRAKPPLLADFQKQLRALGVGLEWPKPLVAQSYNSMYASVPDWYFGEARLKFTPQGTLR
jgi:hypothetical protein